MSYIQVGKRSQSFTPNTQIQKDSVRAIDLSIPVHELEQQMKTILENKIFGMSFSPYLEGQSPADKSIITEDQIRERMSIIAPYTTWIRSFSCTDGNELIPKVAKEFGLKTIVGAWINDELDKNEIEIAALIDASNNSYVDIIAVGNEVLLREELSEKKLLDYIQYVRTNTNNIPIAYVDAYHIFGLYPSVIDATDVLLINCYPFWEFCPLEYSVNYMKQMVQRTQAIAKGKRIIISETGWPNEGSSLGDAIPSYENAMRYFIASYDWAKEESIDIVYFSSFDESWKVDDERDCGAFWGIWDSKHNYKFKKGTH